MMLKTLKYLKLLIFIHIGIFLSIDLDTIKKKFSKNVMFYDTNFHIFRYMDDIKFINMYIIIIDLNKYVNVILFLVFNTGESLNSLFNLNTLIYYIIMFNKILF